MGPLFAVFSPPVSDPTRDDPIDPERLQVCLEVLAAAHGLAPDDPRLVQLEQASAHLRKRAKQLRKQARARRTRAADLERMAGTGRWRDWDAGRLPSDPEIDDSPTSEPQPSDLGPRLHRQQNCYICKQPYRDLHFHYHMLCPTCAAENWEARTRRADLSGRRALLTGGRIKIGFELALKLLRDGAELLVTTRFPRDAIRRFAALPDFSQWSDRLRVVGVDLRYLPGVLGLARTLLDEGRAIDIMIHNAAQTVARPPAWYRELALREAEPLPEELAGLELAVGEDATMIQAALPRPAELSLATNQADHLRRFHALCRTQDEPEHFPLGQLDEEQRPLDLRARNSWTLGLEEVEPVELVEAQLVNAIAPTLLTQQLRPLLDRSTAPDRHVVFVSAVEGQFSYGNKTHRHPHTNMAKAALHMLTRTSAQAWAEDRIYMVSVDTGWVTQEHAEATKQRLAARGFRPPLDVLDGAARVYDPIVRAAAGEPVWGCLLKDYRPAAW